MEDSTPIPLDLGKKFNTSDYHAWRQSAERLLKGASFEDVLLTETYSGIVLNPIYFQSNTPGLSGSRPPHKIPGFDGSPDSHQDFTWLIAQKIDATCPQALNDQLRQGLARGQNAIRVDLDTSVTLADLRTVLQDVNLTEFPIFLLAGSSAPPLTAILAELCSERELDLVKLNGSVAGDPLGTLAKTGVVQQGLTVAFEELSALTKWATTTAPNVRTVEIDTRPYHNAGASEAQELALALATGVSYLREIQTRSNIDITTVARHLQFSFAVGQNFFMEIAKLRAARILWAQVIAEFGGDATARTMTLHAETSSRSNTRYDSHVNILRNSMAAFAAVLGGCDSLSVEPFDAIIGAPSASSHRLARNTQLILGAEVHAARVSDTAAGSWYVETITAELAEKAWSLFQEIESQGGLPQALLSGFVQAQINRTADRRRARHANRSDKLIGSNAYTNPLDRAAVTATTAPGSTSEKPPSEESPKTRAALDALRAIRPLNSDDIQDSTLQILSGAARAGADTTQMLQALHGTGEKTSVEKLQPLVFAQQFEASTKPGGVS